MGVFACFQLVVFVLLLVNTGGSDFHYRQSVALDGVCILADPDFDPTEPPDPTCKEATYWVTQGFSLLPALTVGVFSHFGPAQVFVHLLLPGIARFQKQNAPEV